MALCFLACGFTGAVNGLSAPDAAAHVRFMIAPVNKDVRAGDLQFQEYSAELSRALTAQGFVPANSIDDVDLMVFLGYSATGPFTRTVQGSQVVEMHTQRDFDVTKSTTTSAVVPTTQVQTYFTKSIIVGAYQYDKAKPGAPPHELWQTEVKMESGQGEIRDELPIMIAMAQAYLGKNTGKTVLVRANADAAAVKFVRGEIAQPKK